jgi:anti-sigma regulatory factor (Ser/Thr protein kinase)
VGERRNPAAPRWVEEYDASPDSVADARRLARIVLEETGAKVPELDLVISELAANAVRHAGTHYRVEISVEGGTVVVGVHDHSSALPQKRTPQPGEGGGRGLLIIESIARRWGVHPIDGDGKTVWAELPLI